MAWLSTNRRTWLTFAGLGVAAYLVTIALSVMWLPMVRLALGRPDLPWDLQPGWLRGAFRVLGSLPWLIAALLAIPGIARRDLTGTLAYAAGMILAGAAFVGSLVLGPEITERLGRIRFDPVAWRDSARVHSHERPVRIRMVDDLLRRERFVGRTRAEVVALLGEPRPTPYFTEYDLVYWLGPERGFIGIDSEWLVFRLDGGRVAEVRIVRD